MKDVISFVRADDDLCCLDFLSVVQLKLHIIN